MDWEKTKHKFLDLVGEAKTQRRIWFDGSLLGLKSPEEYSKFVLKCVTDHNRDVRDLAMFIPFSLPMFNFKLPFPPIQTEQKKKGGKKVKPPPTPKNHILVKSLTDQIMTTFFQNLGEFNDDKRLENLDNRFWREWDNASDDDKLEFMYGNLTPITENDFRADEALRITFSFLDIVLQPTARMLRPIVHCEEIREHKASECANCPQSPLSKVAIDSAIAVYQRDRAPYVLVIPEAKAFPVEHLTEILEVSLFREFGIGTPSTEEPQDSVIEESVRIMREALVDCFAFGKEEIVIHNGFCMQMVRFDFKSVETFRSVEEARSALGTGAHTSEISGPVAMIGYRTKTIGWDDCNPSIRREIAAISVEEYDLMDSEDLKRRMELLEEVRQRLWVDPKEIQGSFSKELMNPPAEYTGGEDSRNVHRAKELSFETIQNNGYVNRVVRMPMEKCVELFPTVKGDCKEVVVKMLDYLNVERVYNNACRYDVGYRSMDTFKEYCLDVFNDEIISYLRLARYTTPETEKLLHTAKMLDYGRCSIHGKRVWLEGYYLILEYLDGVEISPTKEDRDNAARALSIMGLEHRDMLSKHNWISVNGTKYLIDFNYVRIHEMPSTGQQSSNIEK